MNEILIARQTRRITKLGIPRPLAKEIVADVMSIIDDANASDGNITDAIDYAIDLRYCGLTRLSNNNLNNTKSVL